MSLDGAAKICGMLKFPEQWNWTPLVGILRNLAKGEPSAREKLLEAGAVPVLADILACGRPSLQVSTPSNSFLPCRGFFKCLLEQLPLDQEAVLMLDAIGKNKS